jgi:hypothetical protein
MAARDRSNEIATLLAEGIGRLLKAYLPASAAEVSDAISIGDENLSAWLAALQNFRVFVVPLEPEIRVLTRRHDENDYPFSVVMVEVCQTTAGPITDWTASRGALAEKVMEDFGEIRNKPFGSDLRCQKAEWVTKIDDRYLVQHQAFWSEIALTYQELSIRG